MARNMGQKATASEVEPARWVWTQEKDLESSLKCEQSIKKSVKLYMVYPDYRTTKYIWSDAWVCFIEWR